MLILPLKFIREEDKKTIGTNLYHLAKLGHLGLPVIESAIAVPPTDLFESTLNRYLKHHPNLKENTPHIQSEIISIPIPESLKSFELMNNPAAKFKFTLDIDKLWKNLLEKWSLEIISKIERSEKNIYNLTPQLMVFSANFTAFGKGFYDEDRQHAVIKVEQGKLDFQSSSAIENLIIVGNKKLLLPQVYYWGIEDGKIKIVKVIPFTQSLHEEKAEEVEEKFVPVQNKSVKTKAKTATKIFLDYRNGILNDYYSDGVVLNIEKLNQEKINEDINKILKFDPLAKIIFNMSEKLNYDESLEFGRIFLFFRNKKKIDAQIVLPETFAIDEFLNLKREYASLGIYSKGSLKIWKQFTSVSDFLNLDNYLDAGFDGAIINLDKLAEVITGVKSETILKDLKIDWIEAVEKFFKEMGLSKIVKNHKQVLITGRIAQNEELLNYFIKTGVWGLAFENNHSANLREHISFLEKQTIKKLDRVKVQH